jgi:hypothetical protein
MPAQRFLQGSDDNNIEIDSRSDIPQEWLRLVYRLNPITAIVVWEVLTGSVSPTTIALARYSPDWERYTAIRIIAGGDPKFCQELRDLAHEEINEIFLDKIPELQSRQILQ